MTQAKPDPHIEILQDGRGREVVSFTTPTGVRGVVATSTDTDLLDKMIKKLQEKIRRREALERTSTGQEPGQD